MAIITDAQASEIRHRLHQDALGLLQAESPALTKSQIKAAIQACEDTWEAGRTILKANMDTAIGASISANLAKKICKFWLKMKWGLE